MKSALMLCALAMTVGSVARAGSARCPETASKPTCREFRRSRSSCCASRRTGSRASSHGSRSTGGSSTTANAGSSCASANPRTSSRSALLVHAKPKQRPRVYIYLAGQGKPRSVSSRGELEGFLGRANLGIEELELLLDPLGDGGERHSWAHPRVSTASQSLGARRGAGGQRRRCEILANRHLYRQGVLHTASRRFPRPRRREEEDPRDRPRPTSNESPRAGFPGSSSSTISFATRTRCSWSKKPRSTGPSLRPS